MTSVHLLCRRAFGRIACTSGATLLALGLASQVTFAAPATISAVEEKEPVQFPAGQSGRAVFLQRINIRYETPPAFIGESQSGWLCSRRGDIQWTQKNAEVLMPSRLLMARFRAELEKAHYPVPSITDSIFEEKKEPAPDAADKGKLQVGMLVKEIGANLCAKSGSSWTGEARFKIFWQAFAPEQKKVLFEATTEGSFQSKDALSGPPSVVLANAFVVAVRNLLADPGFSTAVTTAAVPATLPSAASMAQSAASAVGEKMTVEGVRATAEPLPQKITQLRTAVATVMTDTGSGSGFFVGKNDLLLTNWHVVGKTKFVKVRLPTGHELIGEVIRSDATRDVALVKTEPSGVVPIPLRLADPGIGEDVFALGSPLGDKFNTTLTKGILSGFRELNQQRYLQSDVAILPGNSGGPLLDGSGRVIGITVLGLGARGIAGMNFFIPIAEALDKLNLQVTPSP